MKTTHPVFPRRQRTTLFCLALLCSLGGRICPPAAAADDAAERARANLARFQTLRKNRPNDGNLIFYEAIVRLGVGERKAAFALLHSLEGRKLGLIPSRGVGFDKVWDDPEFGTIRKTLTDEESRTPDSPLAFRLHDPKLIPEGIA
jgi:hypothetical protein